MHEPTPDYGDYKEATQSYEESYPIVGRSRELYCRDSIKTT